MAYDSMKGLVFCFGIVCVLVSSGCTPTSFQGPATVSVIRPGSGHCQYTIGPVNLSTLENLQTMSGKVGRVLHSTKNLDENSSNLVSGEVLRPVDTEFFKSGSTFVPANLDTLFAASLYYSVEVGYQLTKQIEPSVDLAAIIPNLRDTRIVHRAIRSSGQVGSRSEISDNAEYLSVRSSPYVINYFFSYPTEEVKDIPLGLNLGIMNHEFSHLIFQHLFYEPGIKRNMDVGSSKPTTHTLAALDEGLADYFGFLATQDPSYFLCSFPNENRDLARPKYFTNSVISRIESQNEDYFDSHEGGAVFASIQYELGNTIGNHQFVGQSLLKLMSNILTCSSTTSGNTLNFNFGDIAKCHLSLLSSDSRAQQSARQLYQKYLGSYGAGL